MKKFTTSAQKTLLLTKEEILKKLERKLTVRHQLVFVPAAKPFIREAHLKDGSTLVIAAFDKEKGKTLAMIDHRDIPADHKRASIQQALRQQLDELFQD